MKLVELKNRIRTLEQTIREHGEATQTIAILQNSDRATPLLAQIAGITVRVSEDQGIEIVSGHQRRLAGEIKKLATEIGVEVENAE